MGNCPFFSLLCMFEEDSEFAVVLGIRTVSEKLIYDAQHIIADKPNWEPTEHDVHDQWEEWYVHALRRQHLDYKEALLWAVQLTQSVTGKVQVQRGRRRRLLELGVVVYIILSVSPSKDSSVSAKCIKGNGLIYHHQFFQWSVSSCCLIHLTEFFRHD